MFNYIIYRVFKYFKIRNNEDIARTFSLNFLGIFQFSLFISIFTIINVFITIDPKEILGEDENMKYYIGLPMALIIFIFNNIVFKKKLKGERYEELKKKYHKDKYVIPIGVILLLPFFFTFVVPILYGVLSGTGTIVYPDK